MASPPQASTHAEGHRSIKPQVLHRRTASGPPSSTSSKPAGSHSRHAFPFSFIRPSRANQSSTSLVPSTAEGKAIPVDDSTAQHRTSALRELNHNYPSRHRYAKSSGAQNSTYSEPVIVRSYYNPAPGRSTPSSRGGVVIHSGATSGSNAGSILSRGSNLPFTTTVATSRNGVLSRMTRARDKKRAEVAEVTKLPPVEAFTFKSFMANMDSQEGGSGDINADLDRIAEICARSRYSLSNQYEIHYQPHGSGVAFLGSAKGPEQQGPTLQVISSDDEQSMRRQRRKRTGTRRSSRAVGTLETIMSSSRSSEEDKTKKKPAAEIASEVRGRAAMKSSDEIMTAGSSQDPTSVRDEQVPAGRPRRHSTSLALIDSNLSQRATDQNTSRKASTGLVSEPAQPQASTSQLEIRTTPEESTKEQSNKALPLWSAADSTVTPGTMAAPNGESPSAGLLSTLTGWMPWRSPDTGVRGQGRAEGSLRQLLRTSDIKGKGVEGHI